MTELATAQSGPVFYHFRVLRMGTLAITLLCGMHCLADSLPTIPTPAGFVEGSGTSEKLARMGLAGQPPSVKLLGVYCEPTTLAEILNVGYTKPAPFCKALLTADYTSDSEAKEGFVTLVRNAKKESESRFDPNNPAIKKILKHYEEAGKDPDSGTSARVTGMSFLGVILETEDILAQAAVVNLKWSDGGSEISTPFAVSLAFVRLGRQRVDLLVAYPLCDESTTTVANQKLSAWITAIVKSNSKKGAPSEHEDAGQIRTTVRQFMTEEEFKATGLSKLSGEELAALDAWVARYTLVVAQYSIKQNKADSELPTTLDDLLGCTVVGNDGEFLGVISTSTVDSKSLMNSVGSYGSSVSSTSIFNSVSRYGSTVSRLSAFNEIATSPPSIFNKQGKFVAFLTNNALKTPRIDPKALIAWLKSK